MSEKRPRAPSVPVSFDPMERGAPSDAPLDRFCLREVAREMATGALTSAAAPRSDWVVLVRHPSVVPEGRGRLQSCHLNAERQCRRLAHCTRMGGDDRVPQRVELGVIVRVARLSARAGVTYAICAYVRAVLIQTHAKQLHEVRSSWRSKLGRARPRVSEAGQQQAAIFTVPKAAHLDSKDRKAP